jgi:hypothetical protein
MGSVAALLTARLMCTAEQGLERAALDRRWREAEPFAL